MRWPGVIEAGRTTDAMVQYVDVLPTLLELCEIDCPTGLDGSSFAQVVLGEKETHNDLVYGVHTTRGIINGSQSYPIRSIRDTRYKYIRNLNHQTDFSNVLIKGDGSSYWKSWLRDASTDDKAKRLVERYIKRPAVELYDLLHDPFEQHNLAGKPGYRKITRQLDGHLRKWMHQQGDLGHETEMTVKPHRTMQ